MRFRPHNTSVVQTTLVCLTLFLAQYSCTVCTKITNMSGGLPSHSSFSVMSLYKVRQTTTHSIVPSVWKYLAV